MKPLWSLGFRPFFLFASLLSALALLVWLLELFGFGLLPFSYWNSMIWHGHEMTHGFSIAIVAGFLLTAIQNWTGIPGINGTKLKILFSLWILPRILIFVAIPETFIGGLTVLIDLSFLPLLIFFLIPHFKSPEVKLERVFILFFTLVWIGNFFTHLSAWPSAIQLFPEKSHSFLLDARHSLHLSINTIVLIIVLIGGRVIPWFTEGTLSKKQPKTFDSIEKASHISAILFLLTHFFFSSHFISAWVALIAGVFHAIRLWGWYVPRIKKVPLLWILHSGYFWIVLGFFLQFASHYLNFPSSIALHSFTAGGIGVVIFGMIARVSLGHTGRLLHPHWLTVLGFVLINLAAATRVSGHLLGQLILLQANFVRYSWLIAGLFWSAAFFIFFFVHFKILTEKRADS